MRIRVNQIRVVSIYSVRVSQKMIKGKGDEKNKSDCIREQRLKETEKDKSRVITAFHYTWRAPSS